MTNRLAVTIIYRPGCRTRHNFIWYFCIKFKGANLEYEDLSRGSVDVEFAVGGVIGVDSLPREEVHDVLWTILVSVGGGHLPIPEHHISDFSAQALSDQKSLSPRATIREPVIP